MLLCIFRPDVKLCKKDYVVLSTQHKADMQTTCELNRCISEEVSTARKGLFILPTCYRKLTVHHLELPTVAVPHSTFMVLTESILV